MSKYLHDSTRSKLTATVCNVLIKAYIELFNSEVKVLYQAERNEGAKWKYEVCDRSGSDACMRTRQRTRGAKGGGGGGNGGQRMDGCPLLFPHTFVLFFPPHKTCTACLSCFHASRTVSTALSAVWRSMLWRRARRPWRSAAPSRWYGQRMLRKIPGDAAGLSTHDLQCTHVLVS